MKPLPRSWFADSALALAPKLLGKIVKKGACAGIIVETEAYGTDVASHAYRVTARSAPMRDSWGHWYVYFTYGMHWCANVTCDKEGTGAVLIRAVEPIEGIAHMQRRRTKNKVQPCNKVEPCFSLENLCSGPAKFCQAFGITGKDNKKPLAGDFAIFDAPEIPASQIATSARVGIRNGTELPWRFYIKDNPFTSPVRNQISNGAGR